MNKLLLTIFISVFLTGVIVAGSLLTSNIEVTKATTDILEDNLTISLEVSAISCDGTSCYAKVFQEGLLNTEWRTQNIGQTTAELEDERDEWIVNRLESYAEVKAIRDAKTIDIKNEPILVSASGTRVIVKEVLEEVIV